MHKLLAALVATIGFTQALVLPSLSPSLENRDLSPNENFENLLLARAGPVCNKSNSKQCTTCSKKISLIKGKCDPKKKKCPPKQGQQAGKPKPGPTTQKPKPKPTTPTPKPKPKPVAPKPKPATGKKTCKPGKKCKRDEVEDEDSPRYEGFPGDEGYQSDDEGSPEEEDQPASGLTARAETEIRMFDTRMTPWAKDDSIMTRGLSACSVVAVWNTNRVIMTHIPPAHPLPNGDILDSQQTLQHYLQEIDTKMTATPLVGPKSGYFLAHDNLDAADKEVVKNWAMSRGISLQTRSYSTSTPPGATLRLTLGTAGKVTDQLR